jgi:hypothetical protein
MRVEWSSVRWSIERLLAIGLTFLLWRSAIVHLGNPYYFLSSIYAYNLTDSTTGQIAAFLLPHAELLLGLVLFLGIWKRPAYAFTAVLFAVFAVAQLAALAQGLKISCGCYGSGESLEIGAVSVTIALGCGVASLLGAFLAEPEVFSCPPSDVPSPSLN